MKTPRPNDRHFLEAVLENVEVAVDAVTQSEAVRSIPVIGTAFKVCRALDDLRSRALAAKLARFVTEPALRTTEAGQLLQQKIANDPDEASKVGETLFLLLDRLVELDKPAVLARLYAAYLRDELNSSMLMRCALAVDQAFHEDLLALLNAKEGPLYKAMAQDFAWLPSLEASGLVLHTSARMPTGHFETVYFFSGTGTALWKAWNHSASEA